MKTKEKFVILFLIISLVTSAFINYRVYAAETTYKVEQVTSAADINSNNIYQYIIVYEDEEANSYALGSTKSSNGSNMGTDNAVPITISDGKISTSSDIDILWHFTKSKVTVSEEGDLPAIAYSDQVSSGGRMGPYQLQIVSGGSAGSTGIRYVTEGNSFNFELGENNSFKISENNCKTESKYLSFHISSRDGQYFMKAKEDAASDLKIYKVIKNYTYTSSKLLDSEETAAIETVTVNKTVSEYKDYSNTAIAEVSLSTSGAYYEKICDVILILDDSTSVYTTVTNEDGSEEKTRAQIIRDDALLFAQKLLEINEENRISVVKFGGNITNEDDVDAIGFSSDIDEVESMIGGDKAAFAPGTNYTAAFKKANEIYEEYGNPDHGKVVIFISDGMPSIYNNISYSVYNDTGDANGIATNWINYVKNTPLQEAELMKATGTTIYTIGALEEDTSMTDSDGFIIPAGTTKEILTNIANGKANFYEFDKIQSELESILNDISKDFNYYPTNAIVFDNLTSDIELLTKNVNGYIPQIVFKRGDTEIEKITFNEDGTEAYSSENPGVNILDGKKFTGKYISFDGDSMTWNIGDLFKETYSLEFPIYLNNTVNTYGEGSSRPTGNYQVSETTKLQYTDVTNKEVTKEFDYAELKWVNPNEPDNPSNNNNNQGGGAAGGGAQGGGSVIQNIYNGLLPKAGSASSFIITLLGIVLIVIAIRMRNMKKNKKKK